MSIAKGRHAAKAAAARGMCYAACSAFVLGMAAVGSSGVVAAPQNGPKLGLAATIEVCQRLDNGRWIFRGAITVANTGNEAGDIVSLENPLESKDKGPWTPELDTRLFTASDLQSPEGIVVPAGGSVRFLYTKGSDTPPPEGSLRVVPTVTYAEHGGGGGQKTTSTNAEWPGGTPAACAQADASNCVWRASRWQIKAGAVNIWPAPFQRSEPFFQSGRTWQQVLNFALAKDPPSTNPYWAFAAEWIAATLNQARGAVMADNLKNEHYAPLGEWLESHQPNACKVAGTCADQAASGTALGTFNDGQYPDGPQLCD
jgi:hypothetical protein